jgi:hypothetical protein
VYNRNRLRHKTPLGPVMSFGEVYSFQKKPARSVRHFLQKKRTEKIRAEDQKMTVSFRRISNSNLNIDNGWVTLLSLWSLHSLKSKFKMFLFKFYNNTLGLNVRVSHFNLGHNRACFLCLVRNDGESEEESFFHLFYDCITTRTLHELFITRWLPDTPLTIENKKKLWFYGALPSDEKLNLFHCTALLLFQFQIWQCKLSKKYPPFTH